MGPPHQADMHSPQGRMHGYGGHHHPASVLGGPAGQQLMPPLVKPQPSKRLEIVDPRHKSADAAADDDGCPAAAAAPAGKGGSSGRGQQQKRRGSEGSPGLGRRGSGPKGAGGGASAGGAAVLSL